MNELELIDPCQNCGLDEAEFQYGKLTLCEDCFEEAKEIDENPIDVEFLDNQTL